LPPQKQERRRIQINHSQQLLLSQSSPHLPKKPFPQLPQPLPLQKNNKMIIQIQLPPKKPFLLQHALLDAQPQLVAVKSLIVLLPPNFIYGLFYAWRHVNVSVERYIFFTLVGTQHMDKRLALISIYSKIGI